MIDSAQSRLSPVLVGRLNVAEGKAASVSQRARQPVVKAAYVNRRPMHPWTNFHTSSNHPTVQDQQPERSRSPAGIPMLRRPAQMSAEKEQELEKLMIAFKLRRKQKVQLSLFLEFGLTIEELQSLIRRRVGVLDHRPSTIRCKFEFLVQNTLMSKEQLKKFFLKFPRILEYNMKKTVKPRLDYLLSIGLKREDFPKILFRAPAVTELSVENTLAPRVEFLQDMLGIRKEILRKTLLKAPQLLTYSQESMSARVAFLQEWNMSATDLNKVIVSHPQVLHYSVRSMSEHISFLLHVGIERNNIRRVITKFPQILSLDLKGNVIPKLRYLEKELGGTIEMVENNPVIMGLSLKKRIIPRHRFITTLSALEDRMPVPIHWFKCSDAVFASNIAKVPLEEFMAFKEKCMAEP